MCDSFGRCLVVSRWCTSAIILGVLALGGFLMLFSYLGLTINKRVNQDEYAIFHNIYTEQLSDTKTQGTYNLNLGDEIWRVPSIVQPLEFSNLVCLSSDGVRTTLDITVQYKYNQESIRSKLYMEFGGDDQYRQAFTLQVAASIYKSCGNFTAALYYDDRATIESLYNAWLIADIDRSGLNIAISNLQLKNVDFPESLKSAIAAKQAAKQDAVTATNSRNSQLIAARTIMLEAQRQANLKVIAANATATVNLAQANALAQVVRAQFVAAGKALGAPCRVLRQRAQQVRNGTNTNSTLQYSCVEFVRSEVVRLANRPIISFSGMNF